MNPLSALRACSLLLLFVPSAVQAQASLLSGFGGAAGYGTECLGASDDGSSAEIDLSPYFPSGLQFFDRTHTSVFVNVNGNITFGAPQACYTPTPFPIADQPMIAPYWGDVDIREEIPPFLIFPRDCDGPEGALDCTPMTVGTCHAPASNGVWYHLEEGRMIATWDRVGYYRCHDDSVMSFQLVLTAAPSCGGDGDFDVEFRYNRCEWTTGDASGGENGFGGTPAQAGFDAGNLTDFVEIMGSRTGTIHTTLCTMSNVDEPGVWRFQIRSGTVICPDAGDDCDTGLLGVCATGQTSCVGDATECTQEVEASPERCDALDNDCDGMTDEGDGLCGATQVCDRGLCVDGCFEGGCPEGESCTGLGVCVETACVDITCPEGERCVEGSCRGACDGVSCPPGQSCRGGRCIDLCETLTCDECTVCVGGACIASCEFAGCPDGQTCGEDGRCVDDSCVDVTCPDTETCVDGRCVGACEDVTCPMGQRCEAGTCIDAGPPDAGPPPPPPDAGLPSDAGAPPPPTDAGSVEPMPDAGIDGGRFVPPSGAACACRAVGVGRTRAPWLPLLLVAAVAATRRRRARARFR